MPQSLSTLDDRALWERACRGDDAAWGTLCDRFGPAMTALLLGRAESGAVPGVLEEILGRARGELPRIPDPSAVGTWLLDRARTHPTVRPRAPAGDVLRQLDRLDADAKEAVLFEVAAGLDADGIADLLHVRRSEIETRLERAHAALGKSVDPASLARAVAPHRYRRRPPRRSPLPAILVLLLVALGVGAFLFFRNLPEETTGWRVAWTSGARGVDHLAAGERLETGPEQRARLALGDASHVDVEPGSAVRRAPGDRSPASLALERGALQASLGGGAGELRVTTPSARIVPEGAASFIVETEGGGVGLVVVREGAVRVEGDAVPTVFVPAKASCRLFPGSGPGAPYFGDATESLRDVSPDGAVAAALEATEPRDTLLLWHLLPRIEAGDRELVVTKVAELVPPPDGVSAEAIVTLDPAAMRAWEKVLRTHW